MFFAISGFLIAQSLARRSLSSFLFARALRIFPGLAVCVFVTAVVASAALEFTMVEYFASTQTLKFVLGNATLLSTEYSLPGVFSDHRITLTNGSLWTLRYEIACYILLAGLFVATRPRAALRNVVVSLVLIIGFLLPVLPLLTHRPVPVQMLNIAELFMPFLFGSWVFWSGTRIKGYQVLAGFCACVLLSPTPSFEPAVSFTVALLTLWIALKPFQRTILPRNGPDYSYGIYIYAYPIQQVLSQSLPAMHPFVKGMVALLIVLIPAILSWHFVERPSLSFKQRGRSKSILPADELIAGQEVRVSRTGLI